MNMSQFSRNRFFSLLVFVGALSLGGFALWAADKPAAGRAPLKLLTDDRPIDRAGSARVSYSSVVKKTAPGVVYVFSSKKVRRENNWDPFFNDPMFRRFFGVPEGRLPRESIQQSLGSGAIVTENGYILTNNHVVDGADEVKVAFGEPRKEYQAKIIGRDAKADVAVLKIDATGLPAVTLGDSDKLEVGDTVLAIGNPFGVGLTVTHGIVSALGRGGLGIETYEDFIQTDAPINPGNSGGALVDSEGRLIGINTAILSRTGASNGIGFAIPINLARSIMAQLVATGKVERGFLGVTTQALDAELGSQFGTDHGALISEISPGSAAEKAGLKQGDVITRVDGKDIADPRSLALAIGRLSPGAEITLDYMREGKAATLKIKLGEQPTQNLSAGGRDGEQNKDVGVLNGVGVSDLTPEARSQLQVPAGIEGALITQVDPDSASARAGLREGDIILELDRKRVRNASEAVKLSEKIKGPKVLVFLWREGARHYVVVDESK
jgi:serine protease Do